MSIINSGRLVLETDFTNRMDELKKYQPAQFKRKGTMYSIISAMKICGRSAPKYSKSYLKKYASHLDMKVKARYFLGIIKRVLAGRL